MKMGPIFSMVGAAAQAVATAVATCTAYTVVNCPRCKKRIMDWPGRVKAMVLTPRDNSDRGGRGPVVVCTRCKQLREVVVT